MKNKFIIAVIIGLLTFSSCSDNWLDTENVITKSSENYMRNEQDVLFAVNASYTPMVHRGMFGLGFFRIYNTLDPYIWFETPTTGLDAFDIYPSMDYIQGTWGMYSELYKGLYRTSYALRNLYDPQRNLKSLMSAENYNFYEGQLKALRGMYYFYLVTIFNQPVFYDEIFMPVDPLALLTNGTHEQFWGKQEEDLTKAAELLPPSWSSAELGRVTKGSANAQLGKSLLFKHYHYYLRFNKGNTAEARQNLEKAKAALKRVIDGGVHDLIKPVVKDSVNYQAALLSNFSYLPVPAPQHTYPAENNQESVWELQFNDERGDRSGWLPGVQWGGSLNYMYFGPLNYRNHEIDPSLWFEFENASAHPAGYTKDPRAYATCFLQGDTMDFRKGHQYNVPFNATVNTQSIASKVYKGPELPPRLRAIGLKKYYYPQFTDKSSPNSAPFNIRLIRFSDVLLMYAEVCYLLDNDADGTGLAALNRVRARVDMPPVAALTPAVIKHERTVELATEGHHFFDIVRWSYDPQFGIDFGKLFNGNFAYPRHLYLPIPQSEIDVNKGALKQNPDY